MKHTKDSRDQFYRRAKEEGWRARSAYKLLQLDDAYDLFGEAARQAAAAAAAAARSPASAADAPSSPCHAVDLCAAPGSWSQVLSRRLYLPALRVRERRRRRGGGGGGGGGRGGGSDDDDGGEDDEDGNNSGGEDDDDNDNDPQSPSLPRLVSVDLQPMAPIEGVTHLQGDITSARTAASVVAALGGAAGRPKPPATPARARIVVCDGAPDVTGLHDQDGCAQLQLVGAAAGIAAAVLAPGGAFVAKAFVPPAGEGAVGEQEGWAGCWLLAAQLRLLFRDVALAKPRASRGASAEHFAVCRGFRPPARVGEDWLRATLAGAGDEGAAAAAAAAAGEEEEEEGREEEEEAEEGSMVVRRALGFYACGDLSAWDGAAPRTTTTEGRRRRSGGGGGGDEEDAAAAAADAAAGDALERALLA